MNAFITIVALGVVGLDPLAAIMMTSAIAAGAGKRKVAAFSLSFLLGTCVLGSVLAMLGKDALDAVFNAMPAESSGLWAWIYLVIAALLALWVAGRIRKIQQLRQGISPKESRFTAKILRGSTLVFIGGGLLWALSCFTDPSFYAVIAATAGTRNLLAMLVFPALWIFISQIPLLLVAGAYFLGLYDKFKSKFTWANQQTRRPSRLLTALAAIVAGLLCVDAAVYFIQGRYIL